MSHRTPLPPAPTGAAVAPASRPAADLDRRFSAYVVDRVLAWGLAAGVAVGVWWLVESDRVALALAGFAATAVLLGVVAGVLVGRTGVTPGKALAGLRVVRQGDGRPIGVGAGLGRSFVLGVAGLPTLGLGLATLGWTAAMDPGGRRRGLHDRIGDAVVVDVRPQPAAERVAEERPQPLVNLTAMRLLPASPAASPAPPTPPAPTRPAPAPPAPAPPAPTPPPAARPATAPPTPATPAPPAPPTPATPAPPAPPPPLAAATHLREAPDPAMPARWRVSFDSGETFVVEGLALVGRRPEPRPGEPVRHVVPLGSGDMSLSKTHAQFQVAPDGALVVMDRGSTNGTYLMRGGHSKALTPGRPSTLVDGDVVRFGDRTMRVVREA